MLPIVTVYDGTRQANIASSHGAYAQPSSVMQTETKQQPTTTTEPGIAEQKRIATKIAWARK